MERSGNFYKAIRLGYILISILIGCMAYNSLYEWQEIEALELGNKKIDELRKEINNINIQMIKFSLLGETILEWNDKDIEHYHARRMAIDGYASVLHSDGPHFRQGTDSVHTPYYAG